MRKLDQIAQDLDHHVKTIRVLQYTIKSTLFQNLYTRASESDQRLVLWCVGQYDLTGVRSWISQQQRWQGNYDKLNVPELRKLCARRKIPDYQNLIKYQLITELEADDERRANQVPVF